MLQQRQKIRSIHNGIGTLALVVADQARPEIGRVLAIIEARMIALGWYIGVKGLVIHHRSAI